jgi:hypothetical protein
MDTIVVVVAKLVGAIDCQVDSTDITSHETTKQIQR